MSHTPQSQREGTRCVTPFSLVPAPKGAVCILERISLLYYYYKTEYKNLQPPSLLFVPMNGKVPTLHRLLLDPYLSRVMFQ